MKTIIEPFKVRSVEPIRFSSRVHREALLRGAGYNLFGLPAEEVMIDLLTDSGTSAMSIEAWGALMRGDESYAGAVSWRRFEAAVKEVMGFAHVIPTHQGRAAERILFQTLLRPGQVVPNNTHFDTTRANIESTGAQALDLPCAAASRLHEPLRFKGNLDVEALDEAFDRHGPGRIPLVMVTVTNNSAGGQPVSMANLRAVSESAHRHGVPLYLDACRFAENAWHIKTHEAGFADHSVAQIARAMFALADGCTMSAKKDGLANIGGFLCTNDATLARQERDLLILTEGFPTYGGLAGRDLEAIAVGLREVLDEDYQRYRARSIAYVVERLVAQDIPVVQPAGGHAVYLDARAFLPHVPPLAYPGQALACALYVEAGIRSCEIGTVMFGKHGATGVEEPARNDLVRLAIPRRVYTQSHMDYVLEAVGDVWRERARLGGYRIVEQPAFLRHFSARFEPLG